LTFSYKKLTIYVLYILLNDLLYNYN